MEDGEMTRGVVPSGNSFESGAASRRDYRMVKDESRQMWDHDEPMNLLFSRTEGGIGLELSNTAVNACVDKKLVARDLEVSTTLPIAPRTGANRDWVVAERIPGLPGKPWGERAVPKAQSVATINVANLDASASSTPFRTN